MKQALHKSTNQFHRLDGCREGVRARFFVPQAQGLDRLAGLDPDRDWSKMKNGQR